MAENDTETILAAIGALRNENTARFDKVDGRLDNMERTDNLIKGEVQLLGARVGTLESRVARIDSDHAATKRTSIEGDEAQQAALVSAMDIHGKALAQHRAETTARLDSQDRTLEALTQMQVKQTELLTKMAASFTGLLGHPLVKKIAYAAGLALLAWLASKGAR
jgi:hypothetical protein